MRMWLFGLLVLTFLLPQSALAAPAPTEYFTIYTTRIDQDAYRETSSGQFLITKFCFHFGFGDVTGVIWNGLGSLDNALTWPSGETCSLEGVYRANAQLTRVDQDLYRDDLSGGYVRTQFCYAYAYSESALVLQQRVVFQSSACQIAL